MSSTINRVYVRKLDYGSIKFNPKAMYFISIFNLLNVQESEERHTALNSFFIPLLYSYFCFN
jgi:hypothetical protein